MQKKKMNNVFRLALGILASVFLFVNSAGTANADAYTEMMQQFPGVTVSDTGAGWTTDYELKIAERHDYGYTVTTGATSTKEELGPGEHYYSKDATGLIPISKWRISWKNAQCIHTHTYEGNKYGGFEIGNQVCLTNYSSGWLATCANCNEEIQYLVYARESTVSGINFIPADSIYVYLCPFCNNMEQGVQYSHRCFSYVSKNYYRVQYVANYPDDSPKTGGRMIDTKHMVDNVDEYEGKPANKLGYTDTHLKKNSYIAEGYVFTGWNTKADGVERCTKECFKEIYHMRWGIETAYEILKDRLKIENFTGTKPVLLEQDINSTIYVSNLAEDIICDIEEQQSNHLKKDYKHIMQINRNLSIGLLKNDLIYILLESDSTKKVELMQLLYEEISTNVVPIRPDRHYHRTKGQLASNFSNTHKRSF